MLRGLLGGEVVLFRARGFEPSKER
jgi:hypothetical protein